MKGYTKVPNDDPDIQRDYHDPFTDTAKKWTSGNIDYASPFKYGSSRPEDMNSKYKSIFSYNNSASTTVNVEHLLDGRTDRRQMSDRLLSDAIHGTFVFMCGLVIFITAPCSLWFCLKRVFKYERLVVLRLGRLQPIKGPGLSLVIPWIDEWRRVDLRMKAFIIPPQQVILTDGSIVEVGCEIRFHINDVIKSVIHIENMEHSVRRLGQTSLVSILHSKSLAEINSEKSLINSKMHMELNMSTLSWGVEVSQIEMSPVKVLHKNESQPAIIGSLMSSLQTVMKSSCQPTSKNNEDSAEICNENDGNPVYTIMKNNVFPFIEGKNSAKGAIYRLNVMGQSGGTYWLDTKQGKTLFGTKGQDWDAPDVTVNLSAETFLSIAQGRQSPLQAFAGGYLKISGNLSLMYELQDILKNCVSDQAGI